MQFLCILSIWEWSMWTVMIYLVDFPILLRKICLAICFTISKAIWIVGYSWISWLVFCGLSPLHCLNSETPVFIHLNRHLWICNASCCLLFSFFFFCFLHFCLFLEGKPLYNQSLKKFAKHFSEYSFKP